MECSCCKVCQRCNDSSEGERWWGINVTLKQVLLLAREVHKKGIQSNGVTRTLARTTAINGEGTLVQS